VVPWIRRRTLVKGIQYVVDETGKQTAVLIDLSAWGAIWEDIYDAWSRNPGRATPRSRGTSSRRNWMGRKPSMAAYRVQVDSDAAKEMRDLPADTQLRVRTGIRALAGDPRPHGVQKLRGHNDLTVCALAVIASSTASMTTPSSVTVEYVGNRRDAYR